MKMTPATDPSISENMENSLLNMSAMPNNQEEKVCTITLLPAILNTLCSIPEKEECKKHDTCAANCLLCCSEECNGIQRRTKVSFGRTMMQTL